MKKFLCSFIAIFVLASFFLCNIVNAVGDGTDPESPTNNGIAKFDGCQIVAWKQIDALRIRLANGNVLAEMTTANDLSIKQLKHPVDICLILDVSGSMQNKVPEKDKSSKDCKTRLELLKKNTCTLIEKLSNLFDNKEKLRISIIIFSSTRKFL